MEKTNGEISENAACWYAVYTASKAEEKVKRELEQSGFETYLPLQSVIRVWDSHEKKVMVPIIPRVVWVCLSKDEAIEVVALRDATLLLKQEECYVSLSDEQLKLFQDQIERADGFIEFIFGDLLSVDQDLLIDIEGLGTIIRRK